MQISVIVPVFNEEKTIKEIGKVLLNSKTISEVIFVDDGSTDKSFEILKKFEGEKVKLLRNKKNLGKGQTLGLGIKEAKGDILVFLDADLKGLKEIHIQKIVKPLIKNNFIGAIGVPLGRKSDLYKPWAIYLSGERAYFKKDILPYLPKIFEMRYGIEIFLNSLFNPKEIKIVPLFGLVSPPKFEKRNFSQALKEYYKEIKEIIEDAKKVKISPPLVKDLLLSYFNQVIFQRLK